MRRFPRRESRKSRVDYCGGVLTAAANCRRRAGRMPNATPRHQGATTISSLLAAYASLAKDFAAGEKATGIRKKNTRHHPRPFRPFKATFHQPTLTPLWLGLKIRGIRVVRAPGKRPPPPPPPEGGGVFCPRPGSPSPATAN